MPLAIDCVEERPAFEPQLLHPLQEGRECAGFPLTIAGRAELLQPVDLASQPAQSEGVLQVHPEVATTIGETGDLVDGEDNRDHGARSEEHTSELQSLAYLVCRLLLEKKKKD